jgi:hypothetical protein
LIATQGSAARDIFVRSLETERGKLRETVKRYPDSLPADVRSDRGAFPGLLWILANRVQAENEPESRWWREQAGRYTQLLSAHKEDADPAGLGFVFLPVASQADELVVHASRRLLLHLKACEPCPTVESLIDAILVFHGAAISGESDLRDMAADHCLAVRRLLIRGDGSIDGTSGSMRDLAGAVYGFGAAYRFTRDARFLATAENCAAHLLESLPLDGSGFPDDVAGAIAVSALLQLSSLAADTTKSRFYSLFARQFLVTLARESHASERAPDIGDYFLLDAINQSVGVDQVKVTSETAPLVATAAAGVGGRNGASHPAPVAAVAPVGVVEPEPSATAPSASEPAAAEPESQPAGRSTVRPVIFLVAPLVFCLLVEILVFRSNFYLRFLEPESAAGSFESVIDHERTRERHAREAIVLGSSRIAEGFSIKRANVNLTKDDLWMVNGAVAGAGARCMYYFLRDVDPHRDRYQAIVMTLDDYSDSDDVEDFADRIADLYEVIGRLRLTDIRPFMHSFSSHPAKWEAFRGSVIKSIVYQRDLQEFFDHPGDRLDKVKLWREHRFGWAEDYFGSNSSMAGTTVDWTTETITFPPTISKPDQDYLRPRLITHAPQTGKVRAFNIRWLGALADLYKNSKTRVIFIQPPRTPFPRPVPLAQWKSTTADELRQRSWVTVMDPSTFGNLEKPELFADHAHLNGEGNKLFSPALAAAVKAVLAK